MSAPETKREKLLDAALEILQGAPGRSMKIVLLNKALFYLDLASLRDTGETVTGNAYIALDQGPVVADYPKRLLRALSDEGLARQVDGDGGEKPVVLEDGAPRESKLNPYARKKAREIAAHFAKLTSTRVSDLSHRNPGWKLAYAEGLGRGTSPKSINLRIALQEIIDRDPWLEEPADAAFDAAIGAAESQPTVPW